jgi:hypothetical protein|tara:strand:+ start:453 stop:641 length:189 start_codon:yes stop_codon:yes gene_type:complete
MMQTLSESIIDQYADQAYALYGDSDKSSKGPKAPSKANYPDTKEQGVRRERKALRASKRGEV